MRRFSLHWSDGTIAIDGRIGPDYVSAAALRRSLCELQHEPELRVRIFSDGGECDEGLALYTMLRDAGKPVTVDVHRAGSMASIVAMAGSRIRIARDGFFFLHHSGRSAEPVMNYRMPAHATATALRTMAKGLERVDALHLDIFASRRGIDRTTMARLRAEDTWLNAEQAVAAGLADEVIPCP